MNAPVEGVQGNTLAQQIRAALAQRILNGELAPGTRLKDNEVAEAFGTSNTPVREALRGLVTDGLAEVHPYRGCMVRRLDLGELAEAFDVRIVLEAYAARLAAGKLTPSQLARLEELAARHEDAVAADDRKRAGEAGGAFHRLLAEAAGNSVLAQALAHLDNYIRLPRHRYLPLVRLPDVPPYRAIAEALQARDPERAAALMAEHIAFGKEQALAALRAQGVQ